MSIDYDLFLEGRHDYEVLLQFMANPNSSSQPYELPGIESHTFENLEPCPRRIDLGQYGLLHCESLMSFTLDPSISNGEVSTSIDYILYYAMRIVSRIQDRLVFIENGITLIYLRIDKTILLNSLWPESRLTRRNLIPLPYISTPIDW